MRQFLLPDGRKVKAPQQSTDGFYDKRAFSILKEATNLGCLPALAHHSASTIDFRTIPPVIAEVHLLDILSGIVELDSRSVRCQDLRAVQLMKSFLRDFPLHQNDLSFNMLHVTEIDSVV